MKKVITFIVLLFIVACANRGTLTGGKQDTKAPEIIQSIPARDTTQVSYLPKFYFKFSERVDRNSFESHVYTIPLQKNRINFDWSGWDEVELSFIDSIKDMRTYQLIIAKGFYDEHLVPTDQEYKIAFSRSTVLDSNSISGIIISGDNNTQIKTALIDDSYNIHYLGDVSKSHNYSLNFIKKDNYRKIYFEDKNNNQKIDFDKEKIAIPSRELQLNNRDLKTENVYFFETDTMPPIIDKADSLMAGIIKLTIKDQLNLNKSKLFLMDSTGMEIPFHHLIKNGNDYLGFYSTPLEKKKYTLKFHSISDIYGNTNDSIKQYIEIVPSQKVDTNQFKVTSISLRNNDVFKTEYPTITVKFSTFLIWDSIWNSKISMMSDNKPLSLTITQHNPKEIVINPLKPLLPSKKYDITMAFTGIKNVFKKAIIDSTAIYTMYSESRNQFGSVTFNLFSNTNHNIRYRLYTFGDKKELVKKGALINNEENTIENVKGGIYTIELYKDLNNNSSLDLGSYKPYKLSEPIKFIQDSIPVRANWDRVIKDIRFD